MPYITCPAKNCYNGHIECPACKGAGAFDCRSCNGYGIYADSGKTCKACKGARCFLCSLCKGDRVVDCRKCGGTGQIETKWDTKYCEWSSGCHNKVDYRIDWPNPPKFCSKHVDELKRIKAEKAKREAETIHAICKHCDKEFSYHNSKGPRDFCTECFNKVLTKRCANHETGCLHYVEYRVFTKHPPNYCDECKASPRRLDRAQYKETKKKDGRIHHTWYDPKDNKRMGWDTKNGEYIGGGHDVDQNRPLDDKGRINEWDK